MSRSLRPWHLLLLVPLLVASAPAAAPKPAPLRGLFLTGFRVELLTPPVAGELIDFRVTALDDEGLTFTTYTGTVHVSITDTANGATVQPLSHVFVAGTGIGHFQARWSRAATQKITATDPLRLVSGELTFTVMPGPATRFTLELPPNAQAGVPVTAKVVASDANDNVATGFPGAIRFETNDLGATVPLSATLSQGTGTFTNVVFTQQGSQNLSVHDASGSGVPSVRQSIMVLPGPTASFEITPTDETPTAGEEFLVLLTPMDQYKNRTVYEPTQIVRFSSSDPDAELPGDVPFGTGSFPIVLKSAGLQHVSVSGVNGEPGRSGDLLVSPGIFHEVLLSTPTTQAVDTCTAATVELEAVDLYGNTVPGARGLLLCGTPGQDLSFIDSTLENASPGSAGCISGDVPSTGVGQVRWSTRAPGPVTFEVEQATSRTVTLTWQTGGIRPESSRLSFPEALQNPPLLRTFTGTQQVLFEPRNACNDPVDPPAGQTLNIAVQSPLVREADAVREALGRWSTTVRLPKCPDTGAAPLKIGPTLNGEPLPLPNNAGPLYAELLPHCLPPDVLLELVARPKDAKATPGAKVEFELTLSNTGTATVPAGLLWLETASITALEASLDEAKLDTSSMKLSLPDLEPGAVRTLKLKGLAGTQLEVQVSLSAWYTTLEGAALTEQKAARLDWDELAANVGCGCQTGALPSQFLPWLALLAVASRARARLRRLTQGERIDR